MKQLQEAWINVYPPTDSGSGGIAWHPSREELPDTPFRIGIVHLKSDGTCAFYPIDDAQ